MNIDLWVAAVFVWISERTHRGKGRESVQLPVLCDVNWLLITIQCKACATSRACFGTQGLQVTC